MKTTRGVVPLIVSLVAIVALWVSFNAGVSAALDGSGSGAGAWPVVFVIAFALVLASAAAALLNLVGRRAIVVSIITLVICMVPVSAIITLWLANASA